MNILLFSLKMVHNLQIIKLMPSKQQLQFIKFYSPEEMGARGREMRKKRKERPGRGRKESTAEAKKTQTREEGEEAKG